MFYPNRRFYICYPSLKLILINNLNFFCLVIGCSKMINICMFILVEAPVRVVFTLIHKFILFVHLIKGCLRFVEFCIINVLFFSQSFKPNYVGECWSLLKPHPFLLLKWLADFHVLIGIVRIGFGQIRKEALWACFAMEPSFEAMITVSWIYFLLFS